MRVVKIIILGLVELSLLLVVFCPTTIRHKPSRDRAFWAYRWDPSLQNKALFDYENKIYRLEDFALNLGLFSFLILNSAGIVVVIKRWKR